MGDDRCINLQSNKTQSPGSIDLSNLIEISLAKFLQELFCLK